MLGIFSFPISSSIEPAPILWGCQRQARRSFSALILSKSNRSCPLALLTRMVGPDPLPSRTDHRPRAKKSSRSAATQERR